MVFSLLLVGCLSAPLFSQTKISGIVNKYGRVTGIGVDYVIVDDATQFAQFEPGDTILLIQMKGVKIYTPESGSYGYPFDKYGQPGVHEFLTILSVTPGTKKITFRNNISQSFSTEGSVQIILVPSFNYAVVDNILTCQPWDSITKTGGVLTAIIGRTLSLNANIDVSGKGFRGGVPVAGTGTCISVDALLDKFSFDASTNSAGAKGESPAIRSDASGSPKLYPQFALAKGANLTGGGGGNGKFSGAGGGGNYGSGGKGGRESGSCASPIDGAVGGKIINSDSNLDGYLYMGGGGGGSTYTTGTSTSGGNGGGIVILLCDTLKGNSKSILANGASVTTTASGNAGAGGGGGGGTIALYLQSYTANASTAPIILSAAGGKGGNYSGNSSVGGGGGGGFINTSPVSSFYLTKTVNGGAVGSQTSGTNYGTSGVVGEVRTNFVPRLNGFLFNSIRSSVSGDQVDSICSNVVPKTINGTTPVGGSGSYTFLWQKKYETGPKINIPGSNVKDYTPTATETDTVWFRRVVTDNITVPTLSDTSKWVEIRVHTAITGNLVGKDTTICFKQDPLSLVPLNFGPSKGTGIYDYRWIQNNTNTNWTTSPDATGTFNLTGYDPPALTDTTYYKRIVTSGRCIDYSATVTITVLPSITGNSMARPDSVICEGMLFNTLNASTAGGGDNIYKYLWQDSVASATWSAAPNINNATSYTVDTSRFALAEHRFYRRIVYSGPDSVCISKSIPIHMIRYHYIENNTISKDTTICSGQVPPALTGSTPAYGSGAYTYIWQNSINKTTWASVGTVISPFAPPSLTDTTWYRRIVNSSKCSDTSKILVINVHKLITDNNASLLSGPGPDTTVCSGATPHKIKGSKPAGGTELPGDYAYLWFYSTDNFVSSNTAVVSGGTQKDYQPSALTATTWFRRKVISGKCETYSNAIRVVVLPAITNNVISSSQVKVCHGTVPLTINGTPLTGGDGSILTWLWQQSTDGGISWATATGTTSSQQNYSPPALTTPTKYRRIILSGEHNCCQDTSDIIEIGIHPLPTGVISNTADTTICNGSTVFLKIYLTGTSPWNVIYNENATVVNVNGIATAGYSISRAPVATASVSNFNYAFASITDNNGCVATAAKMTGAKKAIVYRVPVAFAGDDDEVCGVEYQLKAVPTDGTGVWTWEAAAPVIAPYPVAHNDKVKIDVSAITDASDTYKFYWEEKNWQCKSKDEVKITFSNPIGKITAGKDTAIYSFDYVIQVNATPLKAWETGLWTVIEGTGDFDDASINATTVRNISTGTNTYNWKVTNGKCSAEAQQLISIYDIEIPEGFSPNNDPEGYNNTFVIRGLDRRTNQDGSPAYQIAELKIISGAGTLVFETSNSNGNEWKEWDGKDSNGKDLPEGTYYYLLKITSIEVQGQVFKKSGFVILKRY